MLIDDCRFLYGCISSGARLRPKPDDCCVFCSYGSVAARRFKKSDVAGSDVLAICHV
jgi:hypothetical protein